MRNASIREKVLALISGKSMVFVFVRKLFAACRLTDDVIEKINIQMAFHCQLVVFLELWKMQLNSAVKKIAKWSKKSGLD